jgi:lipopolysaccharide transport system ATP-binding protein
MSDTVIKFENISKQYRLGNIGTGTLSHDLKRWWTVNIRGNEDPYLKIGQVNDRAVKSTGEYVWALKDINLEVTPGEVLGIIGKNGAGKSTLLKILSRVTKPTTGRIVARGRIASLLEVGTGFHTEMTGRENIYMNGSIMGMTKSEIKRKFDEIVDFAGVEKYIDTPVKRYSSGMIVRLGFAVAAYLEPEILVIDEVLAVGDAEFQKKAIGKMKDVSTKDGRTVLFVSHNMTAIKNLCERTIILGNGIIFYDGDTEDGIDYYLNIDKKTRSVDFKEVIKDLPNDDVFKLCDLKITQASNLVSDFVYSNLPIDIEINFTIKEKTSGFRLFIDLVDSQETLIFRSFYDENNSASSVIIPGIYKSNVQIPSNILGPTYYEIRIQAGIYNQRMCIPMDKVKLGFKTENLNFNKAYPADAFRQKIAPLLNWGTIRK